MRKFFIIASLALGLSANAQYNVLADFEDMTGMIYFGNNGDGTVNTTATWACSGATSGAFHFTNTVTQGAWAVDPGDLGQTSNGQTITVSFNYKKVAGLTGTLYGALFELANGATTWNVTTYNGQSIATAAVTTCTAKTFTIPSGATNNPTSEYAFGYYFVKTGGTGTLDFYVDDISVVQDVPAAVPNCATNITPANGSTNVHYGANTALMWDSTPNASSYKVTVGTTPGGSDTSNQTVSDIRTTVTTAANTTYYAKIVPTNSVGDAIGCQEFSFTTDNIIAHCGAIISSVPTVLAPIKSVTFAGVTNTSDPTATTIGTFPVYQDFTSTVFPIDANVATSYPLSVVGTTNGSSQNGWAVSVFIDWNNDGDFDDAGESYFNTLATMQYTGGVTDNPVTVNANVTVPTDATNGLKLMRIKYNFQSPQATDINTPLGTACADMTNGQVEDYTINYTAALGVSDITKTGVSVYPNPFHDVLNISDVKGVKSISVNDMSGRLVKSLAPAAELNLSSLKEGLYIINLQMEDGSVKTIKAIKK